MEQHLEHMNHEQCTKTQALHLVSNKLLERQLEHADYDSSKPDNSAIKMPKPNPPPHQSDGFASLSEYNFHSNCIKRQLPCLCKHCVRLATRASQSYIYPSLLRRCCVCQSCGNTLIQLNPQHTRAVLDELSQLHVLPSPRLKSSRSENHNMRDVNHSHNS